MERRQEEPTSTSKNREQITFKSSDAITTDGIDKNIQIKNTDKGIKRDSPRNTSKHRRKLRRMHNYNSSEYSLTTDTTNSITKALADKVEEELEIDEEEEEEEEEEQALRTSKDLHLN